MTTKHKIIAGFSVMIALLAGLSILSYTGLDNATDNFDAYRTEARTTIFANAADALLREAALKTNNFTISLDPALIDGALKDLENTANNVAETQKIEDMPTHQSKLDEQMTKLSKMMAGVNLYRTKLLSAAKLRDNETYPAGRVINASLSELITESAKVGNLALLASADTAYTAYSEARPRVRAYFIEQNPAVAVEALRYLHDLDDAVRKMDPLIVKDEVRRVYSALRENVARYQDSVKHTFGLIDDAVKAKAEMDTYLKEISGFFDVYTEEALALARNIGDAAVADNSRTQLFLGAGSGAGIVIGLLFALWIITGVVRVLRQVSGFAASIAQGDFNAAISLRERGEIGVMTKAIMEIPAVLGNVMQMGKQLAGEIAVGSFRARFDMQKFNGGFGELAGCINSVCDAYTSVLDSIPSPLMTADTNCSIRFLNKEGQKVIGGDFVGKKCADLLKTKECGTGGCLGKTAVSRDASYSHEVTLYPQGKRVEAAVVAAPLRDLSGATHGFMEIITDITAMKDAQGTMLNVAHEAMDIADRVAAASEELSTQVEQVSRGAEMQRTRVESTATAMNEMNSTVIEVARNAGHASEQSEETRKRADGGADLVNQVVNAINGVNSVALSLQNNMTELGRQADNIGGVMNVISDIADQTNLLALNAAIEAARAGEAGRGFAVVADEVRKLAEKTMAATQEVGANIDAIQNSTKSNIAEVTNAVRNIGEATHLSNASGQALQEIVNLASSNSSFVASIATAAEQQSATSEEINSALEEVNRIVSETTDGMVQASSAVQDLSQTAQELKRVMERLR